MSNLEYRLNFFIDAVMQPLLSSCIEVILWIAIFKTASSDTIGGFTKEYYLAYVMWGSFVARITSSWMYEFRMIEEIDSGSINSLLVRPMSYYEFYLSQLFGYKIATSAFSLIVPMTLIWYFKLPTDFSKLPIVLCLILYYIVLVHTMSFVVSTFAFHFNRIHSFTVAKNLALWLLSGELVPIDLMPEFLQKILLNLPFSTAVYVPVGYLTGRIGYDMVVKGFINTTIGLVIFTGLAWILWRQGLRKYVGTGA